MLIILCIAPWVTFGQGKDQNPEKELRELNEFIISEYVLNKNTEPLNEFAIEDFILIAAPGMIENKKQAIDGVENLNVSSLGVTVDKVILSGNIGVVIGILETNGTIMNRPIPGKIRYSSTFIKEKEKWRLVARTMTPIRM